MGYEMGKIKVVINKPVYLSQATLDLSNLVMYEFHYDYMVPKYGAAVPGHGPENLMLCYMDTNSLVHHISKEDFYANIAGDERFDTSGYVPRQTIARGSK